MNITFGKLKGTSVALALLRHQDYVAWLFNQTAPSGPMKPVLAEARRLIQQFDAKPLVRNCMGCGDPATRFSVYHGNFEPYWWCDSCDPYSLGAVSGRLSICRTYSHALDHVTLFNAGRRQDYRDLLRAVAEAKGLPRRVGEKQAAAFF